MNLFLNLITKSICAGKFHPPTHAAACRCKLLVSGGAGLTDREGEGLWACTERGHREITSSHPYGLEYSFFFLKRWDYAVVLLKPLNCEWIDFWKVFAPRRRRCKRPCSQNKYRRLDRSVLGFQIKAHRVSQCQSVRPPSAVTCKQQSGIFFIPFSPVESSIRR